MCNVAGEKNQNTEESTKQKSMTCVVIAVANIEPTVCNCSVLNVNGNFNQVTDMGNSRCP